MNETPDLYLDELHMDLQLQQGKSVSTSTVWRALRKAGFTMKKVCLTGSSHIIPAIEDYLLIHWHSSCVLP